MRNLYCLFLPLALAAVSCSPLTFSLHLDMRAPSQSGLDLSNKNISVMYIDNGNKTDSLFLSGVSEAFAQSVERDYFSGHQTVNIFNIKKKTGADYASKDSLVKYIMETESDVAFMFELESLGKTVLSPINRTASPASADSLYYLEATSPFAIRLYSYDSLNPADKVLVFNGKSNAVATVFTNGNEDERTLMDKAADAMYDAGTVIGRQSSKIFMSEWKHSSFTLYYYDNDESWYKASQAAYDYDWKTAIDTWITLLDTNDLKKRSCIEYNLAVAFYVLGQKSLAEQWLDRSDADYMLPESSYVRKMINK